MRIVIIFTILMITAFQLKAQNYQKLDSISYQYFIQGDWDALEKLDKTLKDNTSRFKYLNQRIGYAYFMKKKYFQSMKHYERALKQDKSDEITHLYLYYNGLNTGNEAYALHHAGHLSEETIDALKIKRWKIVDYIDLEYNSKTDQEALREDASYKRIGIGHRLSNKWTLYHTYSMFDQITDYTTQITQNEYFISTGYSLTPTLFLQAGYKNVDTRVNTETDSLSYPGNLYALYVNKKLNRFDIAASASAYHLDYWDVYQYGLHFGTAFSGWLPAYVKSSLYYLNEMGWDVYGNYQTDKRFIFTQSAGMLWFKHLWTEAYITLGNLNNFNELNGMYLYNTLDPTKFRYGFSAYVYLGKHLTLYSNYTLDKKYFNLFGYYYNQNSISGGIIWKI